MKHDKTHKFQEINTPLKGCPFMAEKMNCCSEKMNCCSEEKESEKVVPVVSKEEDLDIYDFTQDSFSSILDPKVEDPFHDKAQALKSMGFTNEELNLILLKQNNGDLQVVVQELLNL